MAPDWRFASAETHVLWDFTDCPLPDGLSAINLQISIRRALKDMGYRDDIIDLTAYGDLAIPTDLYGFYLCHVSPEVVPRKRILVDLLGLALENRETRLNVLLILGDISRDMGFLRALHSVKSRGDHNILLSQPKEASGNQLDCVNTNLVWQSLAARSCPPRLL